MKKKCRILALCSFAISIGIFLFTYLLYHYLTPDGSFSPVFQQSPAKPFITFLFGIWGVTFLSAGVISLLIVKIFFSEKSGKTP